MWRGGVGMAYLLPALSAAGASLARPCSVSTSRSSNRTGAFNSSGSRRKVHVIAHGKLRVCLGKQTRPSTLYKAAFGYFVVAGQDTWCLAHSHCRSRLRACRSTAR
jgi:hypothetical protein